MASAKRSRRYLRPNQCCYLCGQVIMHDEAWDRDHVPPRRLFGKRALRSLHTQLDWLPTHVRCNQSYRADEEYAITALAPIALTHDREAIPTESAKPVLEDMGRSLMAGHAVGLHRSLAANWGRVVGPRLETIVDHDWTRVDRFLWKVVRGLYFMTTDRLLPGDARHKVSVFTSMMTSEAYADPAILCTLSTAPMGKHSQIFDYKWACLVQPDGSRAHNMLFLLWESILARVAFLDPTSPSLKQPVDPGAE
jgi:hypothetical protein